MTCLKLKIFELNTIIENHQKRTNFEVLPSQAQSSKPQQAHKNTIPHNTTIDSDGWKFQRPGARPRQHISTSHVTQNRFNVLATEEENAILIDSNMFRPFKASQTFTKSKNSNSKNSEKSPKKFGPGRAHICTSNSK